MLIWRNYFSDIVITFPSPVPASLAPRPQIPDVDDSMPEISMDVFLPDVSGDVSSPCVDGSLSKVSKDVSVPDVSGEVCTPCVDASLPKVWGNVPDVSGEAYVPYVTVGMLKGSGGVSLPTVSSPVNAPSVDVSGRMPDAPSISGDRPLGAESMTAPVVSAEIGEGSLAVVLPTGGAVALVKMGGYIGLSGDMPDVEVFRGRVAQGGVGRIS